MTDAREVCDKHGTHIYSLYLMEKQVSFVDIRGMVKAIVDALIGFGESFVCRISQLSFVKIRKVLSRFIFLF